MAKLSHPHPIFNPTRTRNRNRLDWLNVNLQNGMYAVVETTVRNWLASFLNICRFLIAVALTMYSKFGFWSASAEMG